ncbi:MAG TPA: hypothetical protein VKS43_01405 [Burkholderiales bacterium]|nr:hypothetical protein [Burkholderiales bacterium]
MKRLAHLPLSTLALSLALCGCGLQESKPDEHAFPGVIPGTALAGTDAKSPRDVPEKNLVAGADVTPAHEIPPSDSLPRLDLEVFGLSHHTDQAGVRRAHLNNELNYGLGLSYEFHNDERGVAFVAAGFYKDSGRNWAKLAGPGYQFKLWDRWRLGATLAVIQSRTYNDGRTFVAPIPMLTYDLGIVKLNAVYAPKFQQNQFAVFGFYLSVPLGK